MPLRISRKLTFAASLVPLLLVSVRKPEDTRSFLVEQFVDTPPLGRLAQLTNDFADDEPALKALREVLDGANSFAGFLTDRKRRAAITELDSPEGALENEDFVAMQNLSADLQTNLERMFLDSSSLGPLGRKYLTF